MLTSLASATATPLFADDFDISVRVHQALSGITEEYVENLLLRSTRIFNTSESSGDVSCDIKLNLDLPVETFSNSEVPFHINSPEAFAKARRAPGTIKVVGDISWCGTLGTNIAGCADTPGIALVVTLNGLADRDSIVMAHEFAHTTGSGHRNARLALMRPVVDTNNRGINRSECDRLALGPSAAVDSQILAANPDYPEVHANSLLEGEDINSDVMAFVSKTYAHGLPFSEAIEYGEEHVPLLQEALLLEDNALIAGNIVSALGAIGTDSAREVLIDFLLSERNVVLSAEELVARANVLSSLGWLVNRSGDNVALQLLLNASNTDWWAEEAKISWNNPVYADQEELAQYLVSKAIVGLTLSGTPEARARLEQINAGIDPNSPQPIIADDEALSYTSKFGGEGSSLITFISPGTIEAVQNSGGMGFVRQSLDELTAIQASGLKNYYE